MHNILHFQEIDSTNTYLKREYADLADQSVVLADHQTQGRGRLGRVWSDNSDSLTVSLLLKSGIRPTTSSLLPLLAGASLILTLERLGIDASIKWPNDILLQGKKACGILAEAVYDPDLQAIILGIGLNLNDKAFPAEIQKKAISLYQATGRRFDPMEVLHLFLDDFDTLYDSFLQGRYDFLSIVRAHFFLAGKRVYLNYYGEDLHAEVCGLADDGRLEVRSEGKTLLIDAGEVTLEENYGIC